jgi:hypothetical protein
MEKIEQAHGFEIRERDGDFVRKPQTPRGGHLSAAGHELAACTQHVRLSLSSDQSRSGAQTRRYDAP